MKNRTTRSDFHNDMRAVTSQGRVSKSRVVVLEALEAQGVEGATIDELAQLIGQDMPGENPKFSIGSVLSRMQTEEHLVCLRNRWYLKEHAPQPKENLHVNGLNTYAPVNGSKVQIAPLVQKRSGKTVSIFQSPRELSDVVRVTLVIKGVVLPIPLWGSMWICYGQTSPDWDVEKEEYYNVETIRLLLKNGTQHEEHPAPSDKVTIAQG